MTGEKIAKGWSMLVVGMLALSSLIVITSNGLGLDENNQIVEIESNNFISEPLKEPLKEIIEPQLSGKIDSRLLNTNVLSEKTVKIRIFTDDIYALGQGLRSMGINVPFGQVRPTRNVILAPIVDVPGNLINQISSISGVISVTQYEKPVLTDKRTIDPTEVNTPSVLAQQGGPEPDMPWATEHQGATLAWANGFNGSGVNIQIVDTGVDFGVPDLVGQQARVTEPNSPYYGWPIMFDSSAMYLYFANNGNLGTDIFATSYSDTSFFSTPNATGDLWFGSRIYHVVTTSKSGYYRLGYLPDMNILIALANSGITITDPVAILLVDEQTAGVYDTVYVDLDYDADFTDEKPVRKGDEIAYRDSYDYFADRWDNSSWDTGDGYPDFSGGLVYFIADGVTPIPYSDIYASLYGYTNIIPSAGSLVAWSLEGAGQDHGTSVATTAAGSGVYIPGMAPAAKIINAPLFNAYSNEIDIWIFGVWGYDGDPTTEGDQAQISSNSWGISSYYDDGWNLLDRYLWYIVNYVGAGKTTFLVAAGNGGPGYGTITSPYSPAIINVGASVEMSYRSFFGYEGGRYPKYGDIVPFSGRGPSALGLHGPDVASVGAFGLTGAPLYEANNGLAATTLFGGTSQGTPGVAGISALVYQAYKLKYGVFPTTTLVKQYVMNGADNSNYDVFTQGSGVANASRAADLANDRAGIGVSPSYFAFGDYRGTAYSNFVKLVSPGMSYTQQVTLYNAYSSAKTVTVSDYVLQKIGEFSYTVTTSSDKDAPMRNIHSNITAGTELLKVTMLIPMSRFDANGDSTEDISYFLEVHDWDDKDNDNNITATAELNRYTIGYNTGTSVEVSVHDPLTRGHNGTVVRVRPIKGAAGVPITIVCEFYKKVNWDWVTEAPSSLNIPSKGSATSTITLNVPANAAIGAYEVGIYIDDGTNVTVIPVTVNVVGTGPNITFGGNYGSSSFDLYNNSFVRGMTDWGWRAESGDWRYYFLDIPDSVSITGQKLYLDLDWNGTQSSTDIDAYILGNTTDMFTGVFSEYGPYTLQKKGASKDTYMGSGKYGYYTETGTSREVISAPLQNGLMQIILHNVLFNGSDLQEGLSGTTTTTPIPSTYLFPTYYEANYTLREDKPVTGNIMVSFTPNTDWTGLDPSISSATSKTYTGTVFQDDPSDGCTASWQKTFSFVGLSFVELVVPAPTPSTDIDLYLLYDANNNGVADCGSGVPTTGETVAYSAKQAGVDERIFYTPVPDGTYFVFVHGWGIPGGSTQFSLYVSTALKISPFSATDVPTGALTAGNNYRFNISYNLYPPGGPAAGGTYKADIALGPPNAQKPFKITVKINIIDAAPPQILAVSPAIDQVINTRIVTIQARLDDNVVNSGLLPSSISATLDGNDVTQYATGDSETGLITIAIPYPLLNGIHRVTVSATDNYGNPGATSWNFIVDSTLPSLVIEKPLDNAILNNRTFTVAGYTDPPNPSTGTSLVTITIQVGPITRTKDVYSSSGDFSEQITVVSDGSYTITITAKDKAGNEMKTTRDIIIDTLGPTI